jgi:hypothetical protein
MRATVQLCFALVLAAPLMAQDAPAPDPADRQVYFGEQHHAGEALSLREARRVSRRR